MAYDIGPRIGIDGEAEFRRSIQQVSQNIKTLGSEMGAVTAQFAQNADSQEAVTAKSKVLTKEIAAQKEKLRLQQEALDAATAKFGEADERTQKWARAVNESTRDLANMENQLKETNDQLKNTGISLDGIGEKLKTGLAAAAKAGAAAVAAAGAAVVSLTKASLDSYAEYEQLIGGVETLFADSNAKVVAYAQDAYKTAGLSANEYMETVTSFSASLLQSLGGDTSKAADIANQAITDMSDNANKMGTSMESIQNAYQGFAKANYTMLDNLKLGYGGTKEEMQRLLEDAGKLAGTEFDLSSFADIVEAIHVIQTEMGITGTTAKEASTTIQGSASAMKSAWTNLLTGISDEGQNLDDLINKLVDSVVTFGSNVIPRVEQILSGIGQLVTELAPIIAQELPKMIVQIMPSMIEAVVQLLSGFGSALLQYAPMLRDYALGLMDNLSDYLRENLPALISAGLDAVSSFASSLRENVGLIVDAAISLALSLAQGLADSIPDIVAKVPEIISNIAGAINDNAPKIFAAAVQIIGTLILGLLESIPTIVANLPKIISAIVDVFTAFNWVNLGGSIIKALGSGISGMGTFVGNAAKQIAESVKGGIKTLPAALKQIGKDAVTGLWNGIKGMLDWLKGKIKELASSILGSMKSALGIHSPSTVMRDEVGKYLAQGVGVGFMGEMSAVQRRINSSMAELTANAAIVPDLGTGPHPSASASGGFAASGVDIATAIREALDGAAVYMDGHKVGRLVTARQQSNERAMGATLSPV